MISDGHHRKVSLNAFVGLAVTMCLALIMVFGCYVEDFSYDGSSFNIVFAISASILGFGIFVWWKKIDSLIAMAVINFTVFTTVSLLTSLASAVLARGHVAYVDDTLEILDRSLFFGFDWPSVNFWMALHPRLLETLSYVYVSLNWQPLALFGVMAVISSDIGSTRFVSAWSMALLGTIFFFHWLPAKGAYVHFHIVLKQVHGLLVGLPWEYPVVLEGLRNGSIHTLNEHSISGLVTVPSFHACAATLLAWGFHRTPILRWPFLGLNGLMLLSAIPIGGHYATDIAAGFLVAVGAITISGKLAAIQLTLPRLAIRRAALNLHGVRTSAA